ncbi:hypothetical protein [Aliiroseovarius sp. 2305UL8-7]|uniref:hypothetical protein n=1 Tax=Aliiroseovarius conchicola TaxID=3121637 RepID=UPI0035283659
MSTKELKLAIAFSALAVPAVASSPSLDAEGQSLEQDYLTTSHQVNGLEAPDISSDAPTEPDLGILLLAADI